MRFVLLTYATSDFEAARRGVLEQAKGVRFSRIISAGPSEFLDSDFGQKHRDIAESKRGSGYWLWKPYYISKTIDSLSDDEVLIYTDVGRGVPHRFDKQPVKLAEIAQKNGFVIGPKIPQHGPIRMWTKRDCLIGLANDQKSIANGAMIQATWSLWTKSKASRSFAKAWLDGCTDPRFLTDQENVLGKKNYSDFVDHRHDQSIMSVLACIRNENVLDMSSYGVYDYFKFRPNSSITHTFLKSISNVEDILSGRNVMLTMAKHYVNYRRSRNG
jgi:hypothetical protein